MEWALIIGVPILIVLIIIFVVSGTISSIAGVIAAEEDSDEEA